MYEIEADAAMTWSEHGWAETCGFCFDGDCNHAEQQKSASYVRLCVSTNEKEIPHATNAYTSV